MKQPKPPSKRTVILCQLRIAGYHNDSRLFTQVYVENRVSLEIAKKQFAIGAQQKQQGVPCHCWECKKVS